MNASTPDEPVHVAITRRVKPGCEAAFQEALQDFLKVSFGQNGVRGADMLVPTPGSGSSEFGILRTFASRRERDAFYESPLFKEWNKRISPLTEGSPEPRELIGLEAWFRSPQGPPPRWKMAIATYLGVVPTVMTLALTLGTLIQLLELRFVQPGLQRRCRAAFDLGGNAVDHSRPARLAECQTSEKIPWRANANFSESKIQRSIKKETHYECINYSRPYPPQRTDYDIRSTATRGNQSGY